MLAIQASTREASCLSPIAGQEPKVIEICWTRRRHACPKQCNMRYSRLISTEILTDPRLRCSAKLGPEKHQPSPFGRTGWRRTVSLHINLLLAAKVSIQRPSPAQGAAPGATHSVTSLRETTAPMRSLILIILPYIVLDTNLIKDLRKIRKTLNINEIPNSPY